MRLAIAVICGLLVSLCSCNRDAPKPDSSAVSQRDSSSADSALKKGFTKLEAFSGRVGTVVIRGFTEVGTAAGLYGARATVEARELVDARDSSTAYGISIEVKEGGTLERENRSYVDYDEIESLIKGIDYISRVDSSVTRLDNFQADYRTRGDLSISTFNTGGRVLASVTSGSIGSANVFYPRDRLSDFKALIVRAKAALDSVRPAARR